MKTFKERVKYYGFKCGKHCCKHVYDNYTYAITYYKYEIVSKQILAIELLVKQQENF